MNKFLILVIILLFSCSATNDFEGRITFIQPGILIENDNKESIWADLKDHDTLYKLGYPKRVSQIKIIDKDDNTKLFYVNPAQSLETINLSYTYSHFQSHMINGDKVFVEFEKIKNSESPEKSYHRIVNLRFIDHKH